MWIKYNKIFLNMSSIQSISVEKDKQIILTSYNGKEVVLSFSSNKKRDAAAAKIEKDIIRAYIPLD